MFKRGKEGGSCEVKTAKWLLKQVQGDLKYLSKSKGCGVTCRHHLKRAQREAEHAEKSIQAKRGLSALDAAGNLYLALGSAYEAYEGRGRS